MQVSITNNFHNIIDCGGYPFIVSNVTIHCRPIPSTIFHQYTSACPFSDLLSNYASSMKYPTKLEIANPSHQLHFIVSHPPTLTQPASWLPRSSKVSNTYHSQDYIPPCVTSNHLTQLQWGFQLTCNSLFCEHFILLKYHPTTTTPCPNLKSTLTTKTSNFSFGAILYAYPLLNVLFEINCLYDI